MPPYQWFVFENSSIAKRIGVRASTRMEALVAFVRWLDTSQYPSYRNGWIQTEQYDPTPSVGGDEHTFDKERLRIDETISEW